MSTIRDLNFKSVKRTDPEASKVHCTSSHAVLYIFKDSKWERAEIEGTLLIYQRTRGDWAFVILNRLHANNYRQLFSEIESFEMDDGLLMFSTHSGNIFGLWIYAEEEKEQFCALFDQIINQNSQSGTPMVAVCVPSDTSDSASQRAASPPHPTGPGLMAMLNRALEHQQTHKQSGIHKESGNMLDQLFASARSSPRKPTNSSTSNRPSTPQQSAPMEAASSQLSRMTNFIASTYPGMSLQQFRKASSELLANDEIFWDDLYSTYMQQQKR